MGLLGTTVNAAAIVIGSVAGILLKKGIPEKISQAIMTVLALCCLYLGITGCLDGQNTLVLILSLVIGSVIGTLLDLDGKINKLGTWIGDCLKRKDGTRSPVEEGFVSASLVFCVGAMAIVGSLESGLTGNHETLFAKAVMDGICSVVLAATFGYGVIFSAGLLFLYQGSITLLASLLQPFLGNAVIAEISCVGSLLILALGLNLLHITNIKIMNFVPAVFLPIVLCQFI